MAVEVRQPTVLDTGQQHLGMVYAKALLDTAAKAYLADQVLDEFDSLVWDVLEKLPRLEAALASPRVPLEAKLVMLDRAFAGKMSVTLLNFLKVVCRHRRFDCVRAMNQAAHKLFNEMTGRVDVLVRTATPLTDELRRQVIQRLEEALGKQVNLHVATDERLIGGLVVRVGDTVYDVSLLSQLNRLRTAAMETSARAISGAFERFEIKV
jgi:F-type H+-transporting ATPase subunit delta